MSIENNFESQIDPQEQMTIENDTNDLKKIAEEQGLAGLEGRVKFGLDPAGMMAVRDTLPLVEKIAKEEGTSVENIWPLIAKLHKEGPWESAGQLKSSSDAQTRVYLVLAASCHESGYPGYDPKGYIEDRKRIMNELGSYSLENFDACKEELTKRVTIDKLEANGTVPVAEGDVALPLSVQGYKGCVSKGGEMRFAQTTKIDDSLLEQAGLIKGFAEVYNPEKDGFERVPFSNQNSEKGRTVWVKIDEANKDINDMEPSAKRIAPGFVLTYKDEALAVELVSKAINEN